MGTFDSSSTPLSKDEFGQTIADRIKKAGEPGQVIYDSEEFCIVVKDDDGEVVGQYNLEKVYQEYCNRSATERDAFLRRAVQLCLARHKEIPDDFADAKTDIMPAIRSRATFELMWLEQKAKGQKVGPDLTFSCIGDHLIALPVYDLPEATQTISTDQIAEWDVTFYEAMEVATQNLAEIEISISRYGDHLYAVMTSDSYDASRLLLLDLVRQLEVQGEPIVMAPHRDALLITGADDEDGLAMMAALAEEAFEHPRYLSCTPLRLDGGEWVSWSPPHDHPHFAKFRLLEVKSLYTNYEHQKELLDALHQKDGTDLYVAKYNAAEDDGGTVFSYGLWSVGGETLLPKTHKVLFFQEGKDIVASGEWDHVHGVVGHLMEETDMYPIRYRVREFPTDEQLAEIGNEMK